MTHSSPSSPPAPLLWVYLKLIGMTLIWGGTFIAGRIAVESMGPICAAFYRYAVATLILVAWTVYQSGGLPPLKRRHLLPLLVLGLSGIFAYNIFFFLGLQTVPASRASLIITTNPSVIALGAALLFGDRLTPSRLVGIGAALSGAMVVISDGHPLRLLSQGITVGDLFLVGCVASWVIYTLMGKWIMTELSPLAATTYACLIGTPFFIIPAITDGLLTDWVYVAPAAWLGILYLAALGTVVGFCWYYEGLRAIGPARASIFITLVPVVAVLAGILLLNEPLTPSLILGGSLVVLGVFFTNRRPAPPRSPGKATSA
jgi:drug/metabolite transporter (DMT)-like permease